MALPPHSPPPEAATPDVRALMARYGPALRRYFHKRASAAEAEDLVQEVFLRIQARGAAAPIDNPERYLFRIAVTVLADRHRGDPWGFPAHKTLDGFEPVEELSPERILISAQTLDRVMAALRELPPRTSEAFILHRFEEMTYPAIARRLGISKSGVEKLIMRALDKLMRSVEDET